MAVERGKKKKAAPDKADSKAGRGFLEGSGEKPENWADQRDSETYREAEKFYELIVKSYDNRQDANDAIEEHWNIYNAKPDQNQQYAGNSQCYIPAVRDAVNARAKRAIKQLFPAPQKHVEAIGTDGITPYPQLALIEHYIRSTRLKSIVRSDLIAGDVTGQWNLYIDWTRSYRRATDVIKRNVPLESAEGQTVELFDPTQEEEVMEDQDILEEGPEIVDFATEDLAVVPPTVNDIEKADVTSIRLRMSKEKIQQMLDEGVFLNVNDKDSKTLIDRITQPDQAREKTIPPKARTNDAGIKTQGTYKYALIFEAHAKLPYPDEENPGKFINKLSYIYYAGPHEIVGIIQAPQWGGRRPVLSAPVERVGGSFWGRSKVEPVKFLQWNLNDFWNMGQDSGMYAMLPIVMTDPLSNPNYASMVVGLAAVWAVDPNKTKFANFPSLYKDALVVCDSLKRQIWESMDVNEMMMGRMPQGRKNNQMMGAFQQDQSINIIDHAERYEEEILNPLVERLMEYDAQFRNKSMTVITKGEIGVKAKMQVIEPQQWGERYSFQWCGTAFVMGMQRMQQQIATMNVIRGIPPQQLNGRRLDVTPILDSMVENVFGPEVAPKILIDERNLFSIPSNVENEMLLNGLPVEVHEGDDDISHIQDHQRGAQVGGDPSGNFRAHMAKHAMQLNKKRQMQMGQMQQGGPQGAPGMPGGAGPGVPGTPRMGAQPQTPRPGQQPPGGIHPDAMTDASVMGRG